MAVSTVFDGCMVCGRSVTNFDPTGDYLVWTEDGYNWDGIMAPEARTDYGTSLNIRAIHSDKKYIYTVGPEGFIPNPDGDVPPFVARLLISTIRLISVIHGIMSVVFL